MTVEPAPPDVSGHRLALDRLAVHVEKRSVTVEVRWAQARGSLLTREGEVRYEAGDALLDDGQGYRWPVPRRRFDTLYAALAPTPAGGDGRYVARPRRALARRMDTPFGVRVGPARDLLRGVAGDWLLEYDDGGHGVVAGEVFDRTYVVIGPLRDPG